MSGADFKSSGKHPGHMKWYFDSWLDGSTREELTHAERAIYCDLLSMAGRNYPPGQIDLTSLGGLAKRLRASERLLSNTIRKAVQYQKIRIIKVWQDPITLKKFEEFELDQDKLRSNFTKITQNGLNLFAIIIIGWNTNQAAYLRGEPYPKRMATALEIPQNVDPDNVPRGEEIKRKDRRKGKERIGEQENPPPSSAASAASSGSPFEKESSLSGSSPPPPGRKLSPAEAEIFAMLKECGIQDVTELEGGFGDFARGLVEGHGLNAIDSIRETLALMYKHPDWIDVPKDGAAVDRLWSTFQAADEKATSVLAGSNQDRAKAEFLSALQSCSGYPFDEYEDTTYFNWAREEYPGVDIVGKTKKKIDYWRKNPVALEGRKFPHEQLTEWFEGDFKNTK